VALIARDEFRHASCCRRVNAPLAITMVVLAFEDGFCKFLHAMSTTTIKRGSPFAAALASVETLPVDDQAALVEVVNKRIAAARRSEIVHEIGEARTAYRRGKVKRGSAADLMRELRGK
jgi:hypothetical protein